MMMSRDKRVTEDEAVATLEDGMTLGIGGWASRRKPMSLVRALLRADVKDLTVVSYGGPDVGLLCAAGKIRKPPTNDPYLRLTRTLQPGFVVTIEPGLYFIPALLRAALAVHEDKLNRAKIERLAPFGGIRVEDDVAVTPDGHKNLTRDAFSALAGAAPARRAPAR